MNFIISVARFAASHTPTLSQVGKGAGFISAAVLVNATAGALLNRFVRKKDMSLTRHIPHRERVARCLSALDRPRHFISQAVCEGILGCDFHSETRELWDVCAEEVQFRLVFQQGLLLALPTWVVGRLTPAYSSLFMHPLARAGRVGLTTLYFGLIHTARWNPPIRTDINQKYARYDIFPQLRSGLVITLIYEFSPFPLAALLFHYLCNKVGTKIEHVLRWQPQRH